MKPAAPQHESDRHDVPRGESPWASQWNGPLGGAPIALLFMGFALMLTTGCRTGADGDPWASLSARDEEASESSDGEPSDEEAEDAADTDESDSSPSEGTDETPSSTDETDTGGTSTTDGTDSDGTATTDAATTDTDSMESDLLPDCEPELELCDGVDNSCDGRIDEGFICPPDSGVSPAMGGVPFAGAVYVFGENADGLRAAQKFWPTLDPAVVELVPFGKVRRSDHQPFFVDTSTNTLQGAVAGAIPTPNCSATMLESWDFDADDTLYYHCNLTLYRGDGELVADDVMDLLGVTDDGRAVARRQGYGTVLGHFEPDLEWIPMELEVASIFGARVGTVQGNTVLVATSRNLVDQSEQVILKFDENSEWSYVRQIGTEERGQHVLLPDGTLLVLKPAQVLAYLADGSERIVWDEADEQAAIISDVVSYRGQRLFVGPADPADLQY